MPSRHRIAVIPGDGSAPEFVAEAVKTLNAAAKRFGFETEQNTFDIGADRYRRTGDVLPEEEFEAIGSHDAILFGSVGLPGAVPPGVLERGLLLKLRFGLDQYINLRPIKLLPGVACPLVGKDPSDIDMVVVRENTEGLYSGAGGFQYQGTPQEVALQTSVNTRHGVERVIRYAFEVARSRPRKLIHFAGKTNVLTYAHNLWERVYNDVAAEYPDVKAEYAHVDALCFWFVTNPEWFDVIVTDNQLGDIITDLGAAIQGGMGVAASGNINPAGVSMFEPIGGTAPTFAGQGVINPIGAIGAVAMMLNELGETEAASAVDSALEAIAPRLKGMGAGEMGYSTQEVGDMVAEEVAG